VVAGPPAIGEGLRGCDRAYGYAEGVLYLYHAGCRPIQSNGSRRNGGGGSE
jgi:hypothetical protein